MNAGSGGIGFVSVGLSELMLLLFPFVLTFALAFRWMFRRERRRRSI